MPLRNLQIRLDYRPDVSPDPVAEFYAPALAESVAYDRATYTFSANGLASAAAGLAGLLRNGGRVRLICHFEMEEATVRAIIRGQTQARDAMLARLAPEDLTAVSPDDIRAKSQLDLIAWLIANRRLEVRIAIHAGGIFHPKIGVMTDADGDRVAFAGSANETESGWSRNYETFSAFTSWRDPDRVQSHVEHFEDLWNNRAAAVQVIPMPDDYARYLALAAPDKPPGPEPSPADEARAAYWKRIRDALANDPESTAATVPAALWPHQESFRRARIDGAAPRVLIADEVGLGKTMQAGIILKTLINRRAADRALILAPKPALAQWQRELRDKFCMDVPILDNSAARLRLRYADGRSEPAPSPAWRAPRLIASYHWLVRNAADFLADDPRLDLAIVDEAHRARYFADGAPNQFLNLLQRLSPISDGMLLLTATPMQTAASDLWALLRVLEPNGWSVDELNDFYDDAADLSLNRMRRLRDLFTRDRPPPKRFADVHERVIWSDNPGVFDRRAADPESARKTLARMRAAGPIRRLMSRHTRDLLESYRQRGLLDAKMPRRQVRAVSIKMSAAERRLYDGIDALVRDCYAGPLVNETAFGFVMTIYRRRLGSSARAYARTVRNLLERRQTPLDWDDLRPDDAPDDDEPLPSPPLSSDRKDALRRAAAAADRLSRRDSKYAEFTRQLDALRDGGHDRIIVFTQFRDTQTYLIDRLKSAAVDYGEISAIWGGDSDDPLPRAERIALVRERGGLLICTETAAESLNLQFCSAIINYDMPWNPMTLEQRIGRIDRIGQERDTVEVVNLFYADTAEWDAYQAMDERLQSIGRHVGPYRDILRSRMEGVISAAAAARGPQSRRAAIRERLDEIISQMPPDRMPLDLDAHNSEIAAQPPRSAPAIDATYLRRCLDDPALLPTAWRAVPEGGRGPHWRITDPAGRGFSATTDRNAYEKANGRIEWFGPGSPAFPLRG